MIEDVIKYIESITVLFTIPYAYIESTCSKLEKSNDALNTLSDIVLNRLSKESFISNHEIESLRIAFLKQSNLSSKSIYIDDILDNVICKIEGNQFVSIDKRRKLLEKVSILKRNKNSTRINFYRFLKNNKKQFVTFTIIFLVFITLMFPDKWNLFRNLEQYKRYSILLGVGLTTTIFFVFIYRIYIFLFNNKINEGFYQLDHTSFSFLPDYYNEHLTLKCNNKILKLELVDVIYKISKKQVESDSGFLSIGIIKFYKELPEYKLIFKSNSGLRFEIEISKLSVVNGSINLDKITYSITENEYLCKSSFYHTQNLNDLKNVNSDFTKFDKEFNLVEGFKSQNNNFTIVLNSEMRLRGIEIKNEFYLIDLLSSA